MDIKCYLAMTAAEFADTKTCPSYTAWMACHYSATGKGLSNLPRQLPTGSMVMVDDSFPPSGHDPALIAHQLAQLAQEQPVSGIVLDLQRPDLEENTQLAKILAGQFPCPVSISPLYAKNLDCPVFLPPPPLHIPLREHLAPWEGREIWLEAALEAEQITVTKDGSTVTLLPLALLPEESFTDDALYCRYTIQVEEDRAIFTLTRDIDMLKKLLDEGTKHGIRQAVGLYQQLGALL